MCGWKWLRICGLSADRPVESMPYITGSIASTAAASSPLNMILDPRPNNLHVQLSIIQIAAPDSSRPMTAASPQGSKVYRLRGIPEHLDRLDITRLLSDFLPDDGSSGDIHIASLAPSCDFSSLSPTKTATLTFSKLPSAVRDAAFQREWSFSLPGLARPLVLDDTFFGLTSLNDVPRSQHKYE